MEKGTFMKLHDLTEVERQYNEMLIMQWDKYGREKYLSKSSMIRQKTDFIFSHNQLVELLSGLGYKDPKRKARKMEHDITITYSDEENSELKNAIKNAIVCKKCGKVPRIVARSKGLFTVECDRYQFSCCDYETSFYKLPKEAMEMWNKKNK